MKPSADWCYRHAGRLTGLLVGVVLLGWGAINYVAGFQPPVPEALSVASLEAGQGPSARWVQVTGRLLREDRIIWPGRETREMYVPLVSPDWQPGQPVAVFVRAREDYYGQPGRLRDHDEPAVTGMVDRSELDSQLAGYFTEFGMPPRDKGIIIDYEAEPSSQTLILGYFGLGAGSLVLLITALVWLLRPGKTP
jgi:hypothetical protein